MVVIIPSFTSLYIAYATTSLVIIRNTNSLKFERNNKSLIKIIRNTSSPKIIKNNGSMRLRSEKLRAYVFLLDIARPGGRGDRGDRETPGPSLVKKNKKMFALT